MMQVKVTRIYLSEESSLLKELFDYLHQEKIRGATVFRGVKGFGVGGKTREAHFLDTHFDLPMIIEFFDVPDRVDSILSHFDGKIESGRVVQWFAEVN